MWRPARPEDDEAVVAMCLALCAEDPGPDPMTPEIVRRTLAAFREAPARGRACVLELEGRAAGYALLAAFWSNELGGEVTVIDELWVEPARRGRGHGTRLVETLAAEGRPLALEVRPDNARARRLYERLGFRARNLTMVRR